MFIVFTAFEKEDCRTLQLREKTDHTNLCLVLTAAVTQASLQSILHKILTAGPSAFNITSLISQAAQLSTQGILHVSVRSV